MTVGGVCMYSPYASGGKPRYVSELLDAMTGILGDEPRVEWVSSTDLDSRFRSDRYPVHPVLPALRERAKFRTDIGWALSRSFHYIRRERRFLAWLRRRPDVEVVHFQDTQPAIAHLVVRWLKKRGKAVFFTVHDVRPHSYPGFVPRSLIDWSLRRAYANCDCLFVHSTGLRTELERFLGCDGGATGCPRIRVVQHGVWTVDGAVTADEDTISRRLRERRLLCFGAIRRNKGLDLLLEAAAHGELAGFSITVAGEPGDLAFLKDTVLPLADRARAAGVPVELNTEFVPEEAIEQLFAAHSALVLPYTEEFVAQSGAAFLALAYGLPVIATPVGGLGELMSRHRVGVAAREPTASAIGEAIRKLFSATGPHATELAEGMRWATRELGWNGIAAATAEEYRRVGIQSPHIRTRPTTTGETSCSI